MALNSINRFYPYRLRGILACCAIAPQLIIDGKEVYIECADCGQCSRRFPINNQAACIDVWNRGFI